VPDESTVRKLTRRLGAETINAITRLVIAKAQHETRFQARAVRGVLVFRRPGSWSMHHVDAAGRTVDQYALLSFRDVEDRLSGQPNVLDLARQLEQGKSREPSRR